MTAKPIQVKVGQYYAEATVASCGHMDAVIVGKAFGIMVVGGERSEDGSVACKS